MRDAAHSEAARPASNRERGAWLSKRRPAGTFGKSRWTSLPRTGGGTSELTGPPPLGMVLHVGEGVRPPPGMMQRIQMRNLKKTG